MPSVGGGVVSSPLFSKARTLFHNPHHSSLIPLHAHLIGQNGAPSSSFNQSSAREMEGPWEGQTSVLLLSAEGMLSPKSGDLNKSTDVATRGRGRDSADPGRPRTAGQKDGCLCRSHSPQGLVLSTSSLWPCLLGCPSSQSPFCVLFIGPGTRSGLLNVLKVFHRQGNESLMPNSR